MITPQEALANLDFLYEAIDQETDNLAAYYLIQDYLRQQINVPTS